jgi:large subunit ribosomal protein L10
MRKEDKSSIIEKLTATVKEYANFYLTDIEALNAEQTSALRRECYKQEIKNGCCKEHLA